MTQKVGVLSDFDRVDQKIMRMFFVFLMAVLALVAAHQWSGRAPMTLPDRDVVRSNTVYLQGDPAKGTTIYDAARTQTVFLPKGDGGFLETLATVIKRGRIQSGVALDAPIVARLHSKTHLTVLDPETGKVYNLSSYGQDNIDHLITYLLPSQQG